MAFAALSVLAPSALADTFTVNTNLDHDDYSCDYYDCTLHEAIHAANASDGPDDIEFAIDTGLKTIKPTHALPRLTDDDTAILGDTQPGSGSAPRIELDGELLGAADGLRISGSGVAVQDLAIDDFSGAGIVVLGGEDNVIARNSLFSNGGVGIDLTPAGVADGVTPNDGAPDPDAGANGLQNYPILDVATVDDQNEIEAITGILTSAPGSYDALFYASETCDGSGFGEGRRYIGSATLVADDEGEADFISVPQIASGGEVSVGEQITVTVEGGDGTSEFSNCIPAVARPELGESVVAGPVSGTILVKTPGSEGFEALEGPTEIPEDTVVDATGGEVRIVSEAPTEPGSAREAIYSEGAFKIKQANKEPFITVAFLSRGEACPAKAPVRKLRKLLTKGGGGHRNHGHRGAGSVRGTEWYTEDRCNGSTFFEVIEGSVKVKDFAKKKKIILEEGETYVAKKQQRN